MKTIYYIKLGVKIAIADLIELDGEWTLTRINVPREHRGQGHARALLNQITADADAEKTTIRLSPSPSDGLDFGQLVSWYSRHGFAWDDNDELVMVRKPR